jgi:O-antigen biosynthesis protein
MQELSKTDKRTIATAGFFGLMGEAAFMQPDRLHLPMAWWGHVPFAFWIVANLKPRSIVELGVHTGTSYCAFCQAVERNELSTKLIGVDTWQGDEHAGRYGAHVFNELSAYHDPKYGQFSKLARCTFDEALKDVAPGSVDLLHIDGLHTYEAVKHDFDTWLPKMSDRGVILFHDIAVHEGGFGVWQLWDELTKRYPHFAFQHSHGLGVLAVGGQLPDALEVLFNPELTPHDVKAIQDAFEQLGDGIVNRYRVSKLERFTPLHILHRLRNVFR